MSLNDFLEILKLAFVAGICFSIVLCTVISIVSLLFWILEKLGIAEFK